MNENEENEYRDVIDMLRQQRTIEVPSRSVLTRVFSQMSPRRARLLWFALVPALAVIVLIVMNRSTVPATTTLPTDTITISEAVPYDVTQLAQEERQIQQLDAAFNTNE